MARDAFLPRLVESRLLETLEDSPVVLIHGPRQCGKTTLAREVWERRGAAYFTLDDDVERAAAESDPTGFVWDLPARAIIDEVQRVPGLFAAIKIAVDRDRSPGRFLLTGSTNVLLIPKLADSLAGRMGIVRLFPFAQVEVERRPPAFLEALFEGGFKTRRGERLGPELVGRILAGGYPAAIARSTPGRTAAWYREYVETIVERDVRDLTRISSLDHLPRLLEFAAGQTARLINVSDLAAPFRSSRPTIRAHLTLLGRVYLIDEIPPWHSNRLSRLVKTPKLHLGDTGIAAAILGLDARALKDDREMLGQLIETFVLQELRRQASASAEVTRFHHFRDRDGYEVDIVLERGARRIAGVEVKAGATVTSADFRGLRRLASASGRRFSAGVVLYDGETSASYGDSLFAVPIRALWEGR